jgi:hypothetical protein
MLQSPEVDSGANSPRRSNTLLPLGLRPCRVGQSSAGDFFEGGTFAAVIAQFCLPSGDRVLYVSAALIFSDAATGAELLRIERGCWLDHHYNHATFAPGETHDLLVAFDAHGRLVTVDDQRECSSTYGPAVTAELPGGRLLVSIVVPAGTPDVIPSLYEFEWTSRDGFNL